MACSGSNKGATWETSDTGFPENGADVYSLAAKGNLVYAGIDGITGGCINVCNGVYFSNDAGEHWQTAGEALKGDQIWAIDIDDKDTVFAGALIENDGARNVPIHFNGKLFTTTNNGKDWTLSKELDDNQITSIVHKNGQLFMSTSASAFSPTPSHGSGVYYSDDEGKNWTNIGLDDKNITQLTIVNTSGHQFLYAATTTGVYKAPFIS